MKTDQEQIAKEVEKLVTEKLEARFQVKITSLKIVVALKAPWLLHGVLANFDDRGQLTDAGEVFGSRTEYSTTPLNTVNDVITQLKEFIK